MVADKARNPTFADMADAQQPSGLIPAVAPEYVVFEGVFRDSPEWGSAVILAAWQHFVWTGDDTPLRRNYDVMKRYVAYLATTCLVFMLLFFAALTSAISLLEVGPGHDRGALPTG